jgi:N6-adenosine-specific RNA methylase IME4
MAIGADPRFKNAKHVSLLPQSWSTLYQLTRLDDEQFEAKIADGTIRPDLERAEVIEIIKQAKRAPARDEYAAETAIGCTMADLDDLVAGGRKFSAISADPPWQYETYSGKGKDRAAERHYDTSSLDQIKTLPVAALAADNCVLFMWAVMPQLPEALEVIRAWGFEYKTAGFCWLKNNRSGEGFFTGLGYWTRANAELCLLATRGKPTRLNADVHQVLISPVAEHSRKPDEVACRIERLVSGPYLELYARRPRAGWMVWGNQIPRADFLSADDDLEIPTFLRRGHVDCVARDTPPMAAGV